MTNEIGFELIYPENCKEISEDLKPEEFRKRINDINNALQILLSRSGADDDSVDEQSQEVECRPTNASKERLKYAGIFIHLLSPQFTHYPDIDIRLRICVALCRMLTIFCPINPFENASNCQSVIGDLLRFLNECILNITKLHSKQDVNYPRLHTILYTCCKLDVFTWCRLLDDGDKVLLETLKTIFTLMRNLKIWAWSDEGVVQNFVLETLVTLMHQTTHLLSDEIVLFLLKFLIEPAKSTQPHQHLLAKDLILRMAPQIEYPIQLVNFFCHNNVQLLQNSLVKSDQTTTNTNESDGEVLDHDHEPLGEHTYILIYALHTLQESLVTPILPCVGLKLKSLIPRERKRAFRLLTRIFSEPNSTLHQTDPELWTAFLSRFNDIDVQIRSFCIQMVPLLLKNSEIPKLQIFDCLKTSAIDRSDAVRLLALKTVASLMREAKDDSIDNFFELIHNRSRDKSLTIRKEALAELASFYKRCLLSGKLDHERMTIALNATLHMYYQPSTEDK
ncbi:unnamed protein product [Schistocephalus solidus]|uniref:Sister chromatid cohesion protein PDS5 n=1 Tax=Schistocephalus solidus TaxID=70667 RepID=A0A183S8E6_SCHSO|nr:unnamed protein product [Schistocephalus solidus]